MAKLYSFGVATKIPFADYSRVFRLLIAFITDSDQVPAPGVEVVLEVLRNSVNELHPSLMTVPKPVGSSDEMWLAFGGLSTNKDLRHQRRKTFQFSTPRESFFALACKRSHTRPIGRAAAFQKLIGIISNPYRDGCRSISSFP